MSDFNRWSEFDTNELDSILGALLVCYATSEPKRSIDLHMREEIVSELADRRQAARG